MHGIKRTASAVAFAAISLLSTTACNASQPSDLSDAKALVESCEGPVNSYIAIDGTASANTTSLGDARRRAVTSELAHATACGGRAKVVLFSSSSAAVTTMFEGRIELRGATDQARARRLGPAVDKVVDQVDAAFASSAPSLDPGGSDPVAQLGLFGEWVAQVSDGQFQLLVVTDGFQNVGVTIDQIVQDPESAASTFVVPDLTGAQVTFAGIGEVLGTAPTTDVVDALKSFYGSLCQRSKAERCTVVTEVAGATS